MKKICWNLSSECYSKYLWSLSYPKFWIDLCTLFIVIQCHRSHQTFWNVFFFMFYFLNLKKRLVFFIFINWQSFHLIFWSDGEKIRIKITTINTDHSHSLSANETFSFGCCFSCFALLRLSILILICWLFCYNFYSWFIVQIQIHYLKLNEDEKKQTK